MNRNMPFKDLRTYITKLENEGDVINYGGHFIAMGSAGRGVCGWAKGRGGRGVTGIGYQYDFYANGPGANYGPFTGAHEVKLSDDFPVSSNPYQENRTGLYDAFLCYIDPTEVIETTSTTTQTTSDTSDIPADDNMVIVVLASVGAIVVIISVVVVMKRR